jgi:hypothetical protein
MAKFPKDAPKRRVLAALGRLGFRLVRQHEHISLVRDNMVEGGSTTKPDEGEHQ